MHDSREAEHSTPSALTFHAAVVEPRGAKTLRERVQELNGKVVKDVRWLIAELTPMLPGWRRYFRMGNAAREFNKVDCFAVDSLQRWHRRVVGNERRPGRCSPATSHRMGLHRLLGTAQYPASRIQKIG